MSKIEIMGIPFLRTEQSEFVSILDDHARKNERVFVVTANPETMMKTHQSKAFKADVLKATYVVADGIGVVKAAGILGHELPGRVTGYDSMMQVLDIANEKKYRLFLLGAQQETLDKACKTIEEQWPNAVIAGALNGYFDWDDPSVVEQIAEAQPDFVFVALGMPRQEKWIAEHIDQFSSGVFIGVGGSFDVIAGTVKRAPAFWVKLNLEWFYRLLKQPSRWRRMLALPRFALKVFKQRLTRSAS